MKGEVIVYRRPRGPLSLGSETFSSPQFASESWNAATRLSQRHSVALSPIVSAHGSVDMTRPQFANRKLRSPLASVLRAPVDGDSGPAIAKGLLGDNDVEAAYFKPAAERAGGTGLSVNDMAASPKEPLAVLDFTTRQGYLTSAPEGIDAIWASAVPGGRGNGVRIIDVEGAWRFSHECFRSRLGGVLSGLSSPELGWRDHGTAVVGILWGQGLTLTGICPEADVRGVAFEEVGTSAAILLAGEFLRRGDVLLLELHRPGPRHNFSERKDQLGYIAIEWWPDDQDAIRALVARGIVVIGAAGNGAENLDDSLYGIRPSIAPYVFPRHWHNPFDRAQGASTAGALIGAGAPPSGKYGPDRSRLSFSNYGAAVDAQGWGLEVTTAGYGDSQGGSDEDFWYTDNFAGTSSASPIVVGAVAAVQGHLRAAGVQTLDLHETIDLLRATGSPQMSNPPHYPVAQRIGRRPNLVEAFRYARALRELQPLS